MLMRVRVHRAICGERNRAHSLLSTSLPGEAAARFLPALTDLPSNQPAGVGWEPFVRGFARGEWYVLTKTFADLLAPRGMVKTYVLLLELAEVGGVADLSWLLSLLPDSWDENWPVFTDDVEVTPAGAVTPRRPPGFAALIHALVGGAAKRPVVWSGQADFVTAITALWQSLWPTARRQLRFGFQFTPHGADAGPLSIVAVPPDLLRRWTGHLIVDQGSPAPADPGLAEAFLRGLSEGEPVRRLLQVLGTDLLGIADLRKAEVCAGFLECLPTISTAEMRSFLQFLVQLAPEAEQGADLKADVLHRLTTASVSGGADDVLALRNLYGLPLPHVDEQADQVVARWLQGVLSNDSRAGETFRVVAEALRTPSLPWSQVVTGTVSRLFAQWRGEFARTLWAWWQAAPPSTTLTDPLVPTSDAVQKSLVDTCPRTLPPSLSSPLREIAVGRTWFTFHAALCAAGLEPDEAFAVHLAVDRGPMEVEGVNLLAARLPADATVEAALLHGDERVLRAAARLCADRPELLHPLRIEDATWRDLLAEALTVAPRIWASLDRQRQLVDSLLDTLLAGQSVGASLLGHISKSPEADLSGYARRREVWARLSAGSRAGFLGATAAGWIARFQATPGFETSLERELGQVVLSPANLAQLLDPRRPGAAAVGLAAFSHFRQLQEPAFCSWLRDLAQARALVPGEIGTRIGEFVRERGWGKAAGTLVELSDHVPDFALAARQCLDLLRLVKRFFARIKLGESKPDPADFWKVFEEEASELYPGGPTDRGLWSRAEGKESVLPLGKPGREQWTKAVALLRQGGGGKKLSIHSVLAIMREDYTHNPNLSQLERCARKM